MTTPLPPRPHVAPVPGRWGFLRESRWIGLIALMLLVSVVCVFLGRWQWDRHHERSAFAAQVTRAYEAPVAVASDVLDGPRVTGAEEWRRVDLRGRYLEGHQVMLRARPVDGTPAVHVLVPFLATSSGGEPIEETLVVVDRGWLPAALGDAIVGGRASMPAPPAGDVDLTARLRVAEEPDERRGTSAGVTLRIAPSQVLEAAGLDTGATVLDGYAQAAAEDPAPEAGDPDDPLDARAHLTAYERPSTSLGNNLSYAFQWWFFAVGAQVAWILLARREADEREEELLWGATDVEGPGGTSVAARPTLAGARRRPRARTRDDVDEDAEIDGL